ncbi:MAG: VanZ family protein [Gammaproteobacteria bacterium]|nr:VanZ family protein [Gammaproteobacteria bacterium]
MDNLNQPLNSFFASPRERRLWLLTALLVFAIYSTLGLAATLAAWLYGQALMTTAFVAAMLLTALTIVMVALGVRPRGIEIGAWLGVAVVYFLVLLRLAIPERSHLMEYGIVAVFILEALNERAAHGRRVPLPALLAIVAAAMIGAVDEMLQLAIPSRVFDWMDMLFNLLAATMAVAAAVFLRWVSGRVRQKGV